MVLEKIPRSDSDKCQHAQRKRKSIHLVVQSLKKLLHLHTLHRCAGGCRQSGWGDAGQEKAAELGPQCEELTHTHTQKQVNMARTLVGGHTDKSHIPKGILKNGLSRAASAVHLCFGLLSNMLQTQSNSMSTDSVSANNSPLLRQDGRETRHRDQGRGGTKYLHSKRVVRRILTLSFRP